MLYPGHSLGGVLPLCREAVGVFYSPSRLGKVPHVLGGRWKSQNRKIMPLSPYVEEPLNSKVIKDFVPELRSRHVFFEFRDSYVLSLWTFDVRFTHSHIMAMVHRVLFATVSTQQKGVFCVNMWQWMKNGSSTLPRNQIGNRLSGEQQVKAVQNDQRRIHQQSRFWPPYFGMREVFYSWITLRKEDLSIANII